MFLAWKEIKYNKGRFSLIIALIVLISYLVYFLSALAYGLASSYTNGIDKIEADRLLLSNDSNNNVMMSMLSDDAFIDLEVDGEKAKLGLFPAIIVKHENGTNNLDSKEEVFVFGIEELNFFIPGNTITLNPGEVILDSSIKKLGYEVGDEINITGTNIKWLIKGFVAKSTYQTAPIMYVMLDDWQEYRFGNTNTDLYNSIWVKGEVTSSLNELESLTIKSYISTLPGYTAQVLTFSLMIGFLILITAFVLGIFIYVLTIQKAGIFGVMKAQGISSSYIGSSVINQTMILVIFGSMAGLVLTTLSGWLLGSIVPFANNILFYVGITLAFIIVSLLGALFSYRTVVKIDPVKAIG